MWGELRWGEVWIAEKYFREAATGHVRTQKNPRGGGWQISWGRLLLNNLLGHNHQVVPYSTVSYLVEMRSVVDVHLKTVELYWEPRIRVGEVLRHVLGHVATPPSAHHTPTCKPYFSNIYQISAPAFYLNLEMVCTVRKYNHKNSKQNYSFTRL